MITLEKPPTERFHFREGTCDANVFHDVVERNEYRLPDTLPADDLILDIGAHIGSFTEACLRRGARCIVACEPDPENFAIFRRHFAPEIALGWVRPLPVAVLGQATASGLVCLSEYEQRAEEVNTGGARLQPTGRLVPVVGFDALVTRLLHPYEERFRQTPRHREIALVKLDCEGGEWEILATSRLRRVRKVCGEYHPGNYDEHTLRVWLESFGFAVVTQPQGDAGLGLFWGDNV